MGFDHAQTILRTIIESLKFEVRVGSARTDNQPATKKTVREWSSLAATTLYMKSTTSWRRKAKRSTFDTAAVRHMWELQNESTAPKFRPADVKPEPDLTSQPRPDLFISGEDGPNIPACVSCQLLGRGSCIRHGCERWRQLNTRVTALQRVRSNTVRRRPGCVI